ncbi:putative glutathione S-transferase parA [Dorcoceras hygrometricum]|uniref:Putative glutathione S-transferase parA n=1 Tax=Dorcoceras hygrometricum TaxID=472368 RepID=A0A2Z7DHU1_9LAMI|nr:putative glutathione S-transferase parA [Dorcoceras hygrometricum]
MDQTKAVGCPLGNHFELNSQQSPTTEDEKEEIKSVPYALAIESLMYGMYSIGFSSLGGCSE